MIDFVPVDSSLTWSQKDGLDFRVRELATKKLWLKSQDYGIPSGRGNSSRQRDEDPKQNPVGRVL